MSADVLPDILAKLALLTVPEKMQLLDVLTKELPVRSVGLTAFMAHVVDHRPPGQSVEDAVKEFLENYAMGSFVANLPADVHENEIKAVVEGQPANLPKHVRIELAKLLRKMKRANVKLATNLPRPDAATRTYYRRKAKAKTRAKALIKR